MTGFLDAEQVLFNLRNGELILTEEIHYITFDEKITPDVLSELESHCIALDYSFNKVKIRQSCNTSHPFFIYIIKQKQTPQEPLLQLSRKFIRGRFNE